MSTHIKHRYDFVYFFDVTNGNPNGDPDAGNLPRVDTETGHGLVTDVCIKRKIRNAVQILKEQTTGFRIWVREGAILNSQIEEAYENSDLVKKSLSVWAQYHKDKKKKGSPKPTPPEIHFEDAARRWMCDQFFDVRTFGGVMTTGKEKESADGESKLRRTAGQVRGPVQLTFARSVDPIFSHEHALTVCAARTEDKPVEQQVGIQGRKYTVPYGLYRMHGYISAVLADNDGPKKGGTGFSIDDLEVLKWTLREMFEHDHSAARGSMSPVRCVVFKHDHKLGNARADQLFSRVKAALKDPAKPPRSKDDYAITLDTADLPAGVTVEEWV